MQNYNHYPSYTSKQMLQIEKKKCFIELGKFLNQFSKNNNIQNKTVLHNDLFFDDFIQLIELSQSHNGWFTQEQVYHSVQSWAKALTEENLNIWLTEYDLSKVTTKTVGLILAGNIPLVGFHDFLSVLIAGHKVLVKTSSNDQYLIKFLAKYLISINPEIENYIIFTDGKL